jgi:hypothetical protein
LLGSPGLLYFLAVLGGRSVHVGVDPSPCLAACASRPEVGPGARLLTFDVVLVPRVDVAAEWASVSICAVASSVEVAEMYLRLASHGL